MTIDITKASIIHIQFGIVSISPMRSVLIQTHIGHIKFHIVKTDTPFLFCFANIDWLSVYFSNINNLLIMKSIRIPVIHHSDHPFIL